MQAAKYKYNLKSRCNLFRRLWIRRCAISTDTNNPNTGSNQTAEQVNNLLVQGFQAAKDGRRSEAYDLFCEVVRLDPTNEYGWLYRAATTDDMAEAYVCLQRVLSINPDNQKAQRGVERIRARMTGEGGEAVATANQPVQAAPLDNKQQAEPMSNPVVEDGGVISGLDANSASQPDSMAVSADSSDFNDQRQPSHTYNSGYAQTSGYPYPTAEPQPFAFNQSPEASQPLEASASYNQPQAYNYAPTEVGGNYNPTPVQPIPVEQNNYYQPQPIEENQNRYYQPTDEYQYQPDNFQSGTFQSNNYRSGQEQAPSYQPDNFQTQNYQPDNYQPNNYQPNQYPGFLPPLPQDNPATPVNGKKDKTKGRGLFGRRREEAPLIATFGAEAATDLDDAGKARSEKSQRRVAIIMLVLAILLLVVAGIVFFQKNNNNNGSEQAANATETVPPPSTNSAGGTVVEGTVVEGTIASTTGLDNGTPAVGGVSGTASGTPAVGSTGGTNGTNGGAVTGGANNTTVGSVATTTEVAALVPTDTPPAPQTTASQTTVAVAATSAPPSPTTAPAAAPNAIKPVVYTVLRGDNLTNIARKFGTTIPAVVAANKGYYPLSPTGSNLFAGNKLIIPVSRPNFNGRGGVIVVAGETVANIAQRFNITPEQLVSFNGLTSTDDIKPGDALLIP